ncbi:peptidoglycan-binding protein, partial [Dermatophilus congolensis]
PLTQVSEWTTNAEAPIEASRRVITRLTLREGAHTLRCTSPISVNDVPVLLIPGQRPFFRDLAPGATGSDVAALQRGLTACGHRVTDPPGKFGKSTAAAWAAIMRPYKPIPETIHWRQLVPVPDKVKKLRIAKLGATLGQVLPEGAPLMKLDGGPLTAIGGLEPALANELHMGQSIKVTMASGKNIVASVAAVTMPTHTNPAAGNSPIQGLPNPPGGNENPEATRLEPGNIKPGFYKLQLTLPSSDDPNDKPIKAAIKLNASPADSLHVPLAAITTCNGKPCIRLAKNTQNRDIPVQTGISDGNLVTITPLEGRLSVGDEVLVSEK